MKKLKVFANFIFVSMFFLSCNLGNLDDLSEVNSQESEDDLQFKFHKEFTVFSSDHKYWVKFIIETDDAFLLNFESKPENWEIFLNYENKDQFSKVSDNLFYEVPGLPLDLKPSIYFRIEDYYIDPNSIGFGLKRSENFEANLNNVNLNLISKINTDVTDYWRYDIFEAPRWFERVSVRRYNNVYVSQELNNKSVGVIFRYKNCSLCFWKNEFGDIHWMTSSPQITEYRKVDVDKIRVWVYHYGPLIETYIIPGSSNIGINNTNFSIYWTRY